MTGIESLLAHSRSGRPLIQPLARWLRNTAERRRQRLALAALDDHLLRDIGVTREQALSEARRPAWR